MAAVLNRILKLTVVTATLVVAGCDTGTPARVPQAALPSAESFEKFGNYELHFNAIRTDLLTPDIAARYGIERSGNRVLLNVALLRRADGAAPPEPIDGQVSADAYTLIGQSKNLRLRRITEGAAVYFIGDVPISGTEVVVFDITAQAPGEPQPFTVKFQREFFAE